MNQYLPAIIHGILFKQIWIMLSYKANLFANILTLYVIFALIFVGGTTMGGELFEGNLKTVIVGYFLWVMATAAFSDITREITREAQWGTLEQLYMTTHQFETVLFIKSMINLVIAFVIGFVLLVAMMVTTTTFLPIDVVTIVPVAGLGLLSIVGLGFILSGLAIVYKRVENTFQLINFGLIVLIAAPSNVYPFLKLLPIVQSSSLLQRSMRDGVRLWEYSYTDLTILALVAIGYLSCGLFIFRQCQRYARKQGSLGHY